MIRNLLSFRVLRSERHYTPENKTEIPALAEHKFNVIISPSCSLWELFKKYNYQDHISILLVNKVSE